MKSHSEIGLPEDRNDKLKAQENRLRSFISNGQGRSYISSTNASPSKDAFTFPVKHFDSAFNRYSQQLACELQKKEKTAVEFGCQENQYASVIDRPQSVLRICPRQNVPLPRNLPQVDATGATSSHEMKTNVGARDRTNEVKRSRIPVAFISHSRKDNEKPSGIESEKEDAKMAMDSISVTSDPVSDIIKSLNDFIASVTIPPPPPPPPSPPQQQTTECLTAAKKQTNVSSKQTFSRDFGFDADSSTHGNIEVQLAEHNRKGKNVFSSTDRRLDEGSHSKGSAGLPRELSESWSISSEVDFSKLIIPPPPPIDTPAQKSKSKLEESELSSNDHGPLFSSPVTASTALRPRLPPPLPPLLTPPPLVCHLPTLPPLHPTRSILVGRSPSLSPRALSANSSLSRTPFPRSPPFEKLSFAIGDHPSTAAEQRILSNNVHGNDRQSEASDQTRQEVKQDCSPAQKSNSQNNEGASVTAREHSMSVLGESRTSSLTRFRARKSTGTLPKSTPPVPPPRLSCSINNSPVTKRPVRRVSFDQCPPSTRCLPPDEELDNHQRQKNKGKTDVNSPPENSSSSFTDSPDVATGRVDGQRQPHPTAQIRPSALRSSSSQGFHSVVVNDEGSTDAASATVDFTRVARSGSVGSASSKTSTSVFAAIRSKLKSYWSPSMPRRKSSLQGSDHQPNPTPVVAGRASVSSVDYELESVDGNPTNRSNSRPRGGDSTRNRSIKASSDSRSIINKFRSEDDDEGRECYPQLKHQIPNTFKSFTGR